MVNSNEMMCFRFLIFFYYYFMLGGKQLWLALGKTSAEKVAWRKAQELKVKLVTVCPGLLMAPSFPNPHTETSVPYLKGKPPNLNLYD